MTELELDSLNQRVQDLGAKVDYTNIKTEIHSYQCDEQIKHIKTRLESIDRSDVKDEMDKVSGDTIRIQAIEDADYDSQIEDVSLKVANTRKQLDDMETEHKEELGKIANKISGANKYFDDVSGILGGILKHQVISLEDYIALGTPDNDTLYYTYE